MNRKIRTWEWCEGGNEHLDFQFNQEIRALSLAPEKRRIRHARCKKCGRKFELLNRDCHDFGCTHQYIPKHKARI